MFRQPVGLIAIVAATAIVQGGFAYAMNSTDQTPLKPAPSVDMASPSGQILVNFRRSEREGRRADLTYRVSFKGLVLINDSLLGLTLKNVEGFGEYFVATVDRHTNRDIYTMVIGKSSRIENHYNEVRVVLKEKLPSHRRLNIVFRIFDDGIAFRYEIPRQDAISNFIISEEKTQFALANHPRTYALPLSFGSSYEGFYKAGSIGEMTGTLGLPLLARYANGTWLAITEAALTDYAGLYVAASSTLSDTFEAKLAPWSGDPETKVRGRTPFRSPWRVLMIGDSNKTLVESNIINNLNEPSVIKDTSWISPGKVQFPWWNGYVVPGRDAAKGGLNTWTLKHYIDFCADNGIEYHSIDGYEFEQAWYGGKVSPYGGADITRSIPEVDLPEVLRYARARGVGTRLWLHSDALKRNDIDKVFATYESWGISGVMVDFVDRDDQESVRFYHRILRAAARHHLTINFHGIFKPTGLGRTYPNLLNHEAVLGAEYNKWSEVGSPPDHEVLIAFIRMLAGPLDTHQGSFRPVSIDQFKPSSIAPRSTGTLARQIAMYVVYENHLPTLVDYPEAYLEQPTAFQFLKQVPVTWEETRMLSGEIGKNITIARRSGQDWFVGSLTGFDPQNLDLSLGFLGKGDFVAEVYYSADSYLGGEGIRLEHTRVTSKDTLKFNLKSADGLAIRIRRYGDQNGKSGNRFP